MKKTTICVSVDMNTLMIAKTKIDNISKYLNECLEGLGNKTEEDKSLEQLELEIKEIKEQMNELNIRLLVKQESIKAIKDTKVLQDKKTLENEQFKRWECHTILGNKQPCLHKNFMEDIACGKCQFKSRDQKTTKIVYINEV